MLGSIFNIVNLSLIFTICNPIWILWLPNYPITSNYTCFKQNWKHLINSKWRSPLDPLLQWYGHPRV